MANKRARSRSPKLTAVDSTKSAILAPVLIESALELLSESGWDGLTMAGVAQRANVSIGLIYKLFADKDELVRAAHEAYLAEIDADIAALELPADAGSPLASVRAIVAQVTELLLKRDRVWRSFMGRALGDAAIAERASSGLRVLARHFKSGLLQHERVFNHPEPALAADVCFRMVYDVVARRVVYGPTFESELELAWERLVDELSRACASYLMCPEELLDG